MTIQTWIIEPRDSLIVRDAKPFGANVTQAASLDFPFPSTTTGGVRTRAGLDQSGKFTASPDAIKTIEVRGPLLVEIDDTGKIVEVYTHVPADSLMLQDPDQKRNGEAQLYRLKPLNLSAQMSNKTLSNLSLDLDHLVGLDFENVKGKPYNELTFWKWSSVAKWLGESNDVASVSVRDYGIGKLAKDSRVHVAINENLASEDGALFQTRGLEFYYGERDLAGIRKLGLAVFVDSDTNRQLEGKDALSPLGGERRLVKWHKSSPPDNLFDCPDNIRASIETTKYCRLMLLTPGYFDNGLPRSTVEYEIMAIACGRYETVSGWDFAVRQPKPTRRLLPAGTVLFLKINGDVNKWIDDTWFHCIGDDEQARLDGFGVCVLGTWDGNSQTEWRKINEEA